MLPSLFAGMGIPLPLEAEPVRRLSHSVDARWQAISFFLLALLLCTAAVWGLWKFVRREWTTLPPLSYPRALGVTVLWGLLCLIVLTMISGARELMTPGAWKKAGFTYALETDPPDKDDSPSEERRRHLEELRTVLWHFAATHNGRFPSDKQLNEIPDGLWRVPGGGGLRYRYVAGLSANSKPELLVIEPELDPQRRWVIQTNGEILTRPSSEIPGPAAAKGAVMTGRQMGLILGVAGLIVAACFETGRTLLFGWIGFLARVLPKVTADGPTVVVAVVAVVLFTGGLHWVIRAWRPQWKWRYSIAASALTFVMFMAGVAMVGAFHMGAWVATSSREVRVPTWIGGTAARMESKNNLKQLALAVHNYDSAIGALPLGGTFDADGRALHGWEIEIGPYTYFTARDLDPKVPWDHPKNERLFRCVIPLFINPALSDAPIQDERGFGFNHYSVNNHVFRADRRLTWTTMSDGASNTLFIGEINANFQPWGKPMNVRDPARGINRTPNGFGGPPGAGGAQFAFGDGSVRFFRDNTSREVLRALATPDGSEDIDPTVFRLP